jgi:hypothetical protein
MPLLRMRFFVGEDFKEPKAFGIYQDGDDFVVYKNKANGQRAVRYRGPDEAYAVSELFQKLLEECHNRGIYPDGKPEPGSEAAQPKRSSNAKKFLVGYAVAIAAAIGVASVYSVVSHRNDGYYRIQDTTYYHYGNDWYMDSDYGWYELDDEPVTDYEEYYVGDDYDSDWGGTDFKSSQYWEEIEEDNSSDSSDYDSWDSSDTDWDSDW